MMPSQTLWRRRTDKRRSVGAKLLLPFSLVIGAIALFMFIYFPNAMERREEDALRSRGSTVAAMAAFSVQAGVQFDDRIEIESAIANVFQTPEVLQVEVVSPEGEILAETVRAFVWR